MAVVAVAWAAYVAVAVGLAWREVDDGTNTLDRAQAHAQADPTEVLDGRLAARLRPARRRFTAAEARLRQPLLVPARYVPFAGRQLRSATALSAAAARLTTVGIDGASEGRRIVADAAGSGPGRIDLVRRLGDLAGDVGHRLRAVPLGPRQGLVAPLARARNRVSDRLSSIRRGMASGVAGARAVGALLTGPRRYLLFAANNSEMRAGSGMFLSVGELIVADGRIRLGEVRTVNSIAVPPTSFPVDRELGERWGWLRPGEDWRNLMLSPRFDVSAELAARMWVASGHEPVDGVIALDPVALQGTLQASGPLTVDGRRVDADNVLDELLHEQYVRFPAYEELSERREVLGKVARAAFDTVDAGATPLTHLAGSLARPARGRHLLLWSRLPAEQEGWQAMGVDGALRADSALVSILNRGGNKLDQFLRVSARLETRPSGPDTVATLRLELRNTSPTGEPPDVAGPHTGSGVAEGVYLGIVAVDLPQAVRDARFDGVSQLAVAGPDGPCRVVGFQTQLGRGEGQTVVLRFKLPGRHGSVRIEPSARVPAIRWEAGGSKWTDGSPEIVHW